jgi:hypothetical protein
MIRRINAVNVCGTIAFVAMIMCGGFLDGGNYVAAGICLGVFAGFAFLAVKENGKENRPY